MQRFFLVVDGVETEIQQPEGWGDMQRSIARQSDTFGFTEEFSKSDLTFYCDGSDLPGGLDIIKAAYAAKGPDADVYFKVTEDCNNNHLYETINYSLLDLYEAPNNDDWYKTPTEAESFQTILSKRYKNQTNLLSTTSVDNTPVVVPALKEVFLPGKAIVREYSATPVVNTQSFLASGDPDQNENQRSPILYFGFDNVIRNEFGVETDNGNLPGVFTLGTGFSFSHNLISTFESIGNSRIRITAKLDSHIVIERNKGDFETVEVRYILKVRKGGVDSDTTLEYNFKTGINGPYEWKQTGTEYKSDWIDLQDGDEVFLYGEVLVSDVSGPYRMTYRINFFKTSYLKIEGYTVSAGSNGYGLLLHETLSKAVANLTGKDNIFISKYFGRTDSWPRSYPENGCGSDFLFTIGKLLKGRTTEKDKKQDGKEVDIALTTALNTLIEGLQAIFCVGYSYEYEQAQERVVIEPMDYFYQDYNIISFDDISDFEISPAQDLIYNTIDVGYEKYETEEVNGADEFNSKRQYSTPIRKHESKLNLLSKLVTGGYPIEFTRQSRLRSNDYKYDNNNFLIAVTDEVIPGEPVKEDVTYGIVQINENNEVAIDINAIPELNSNYSSIVISGSTQNNGTYTLVEWYGGITTDELGQETGTANFLILNPAPNNTDQFGYVTFVYPDTPTPDTTIKRAKQDDAFNTLNNVVDPSTTYNAEISPVRNLLRWAKYINGGLTFKQPTELIKFNYGEANYLLESQLKESETCLGGDVNRELLKENQDFALSAFNLNNKLWTAEYITFKSECSQDDFDIIRDNLLPDVEKAQKNGYISVDYDGETYTGFPYEVNYEPNKRICSFKLLRRYVKPIIRIIAETGEYILSESNNYLIKE